jgi:ATP-dependent exoDNAse (exonuclease V) beta subunit
MNQHFVVYKSSAGSGKTTTLVKEYLKLTLKNPGSFRHILAITFTNKAANEMKSKIIESLQDISSGQLSKSNYPEIMQETNLLAEQIIHRAGQLLSLIIHNYDEFAVSTIDSFVHRIVRTFASDLKLPQGFEVIIDEDDLIPFIVEDIYDKLGHNNAFTEILIRFVMTQVEDEKSYDLTKNLADFVKKQLREEGPEGTNGLENIPPAEFLQNIQKLRDSVYSTKEVIQKLARKSLEMIAHAGLTVNDFFHGKSGVGGYFNKLSGWTTALKDLLPNSYVIKAIEEDVWYSASKSIDIKTRIDNIASQLKESLETIREKISFYAIRRLVYNNIYEMALMGEIRQLFEGFTERTRKVHISEFNKRIHREIAGQPIPFIYERLGRRYRYFLIDEFQDTSVLQWDNLLPLVEESLAGGHFNMVVGDAKQAIYRFRNGEVELFTHLPHLYGLEGSPENIQREQILTRNYVQKELKINYRSREEVIHFNNDFFSFAGKNLTGGFDEVYDGVEQQVPQAKKKQGGYVAIDFIPSENTADFKVKRLYKIREIVEEVSAKDYPLKEISILTLDNKSAAEIATHLLQHNIPVVSSVSMLLTHSPKVRLTVAFLKLMTENENRLFFAEFLTNLLWIQEAGEKFYTLYREAIVQADPLSFVLNKFGLTISAPEILRMHSVYEIAAEVIRSLTNTNTPDLFLQFFLDFIFEKELTYNGSLPAFIQLWEEKKSKESIILPEGMEAVQVMTAHKAKGLKFGVVIADLHAMQNRLTHGQYWENLQLPELGNISSILLNISEKDLAAAGRGDIYEHERAKTDLDFLNKIYVAFTRTVDALYVTGSLLQNKSKDYFSKYLVDFLDSKGLWNEEKLHYEWGVFPKITGDNKSAKAKEIVALSHDFSTPWYEYLDIAPVEEVYWEALGQSAQRTFGKLLHAILSKIKYAGEAEQQIDAYRYAGLLDAEETLHIKELIGKVLSHPELSRYYTKGAIIKTETELYDAEAEQFLRPDRVVISGDTLTILDYKTGVREEKAEKKYRKQVDGYAAVYSRLGYQNIEKKLIYIHEEDVEVVDM